MLISYYNNIITTVHFFFFFTIYLFSALVKKDFGIPWFSKRWIQSMRSYFINMTGLQIIIPSRQAENWSFCSFGPYFGPRGQAQTALDPNGHFREKNAHVSFTMWAAAHYISPPCPCPVLLIFVPSCQYILEECECVCFFKANCPKTDQNKSSTEMSESEMRYAELERGLK